MEGGLSTPYTIRCLLFFFSCFFMYPCFFILQPVATVIATILVDQISHTWWLQQFDDALYCWKIMWWCTVQKHPVDFLNGDNMLLVKVIKPPWPRRKKSFCKRHNRPPNRSNRRGTFGGEAAWGLAICSPWIRGIPRWSGASIYYFAVLFKDPLKSPWNLYPMSCEFASFREFWCFDMFWSCFPMMCWFITPWVNQASAQRIATCAEKTQETQGDRPLGLLMGWVMDDGWWMMNGWCLGSGIYIYIHIYIYISIYTYLVSGWVMGDVTSASGKHRGWFNSHGWNPWIFVFHL